MGREKPQVERTNRIRVAGLFWIRAESKLLMGENTDLESMLPTGWFFGTGGGYQQPKPTDDVRNF